MVRWSVPLVVVWCVLCVLMPSVADAQEGEGRHSLTIRTGTSLQNNLDVGLGYQGRFGDRFRLGFNVQAAQYREAFISALSVKDGVRASVSVPMAFRIDEIGPMTTHLWVAPRLDIVQAPDGGLVDEDGFGLGGEAGLLFNIRTDSGMRVETGIVVPFHQEISPESLTDKVGVLIPVGTAWMLSSNWALATQVRFGPVFGGNGDTAKFLGEAFVGLRFGADPNALLFF